MRLREAAEVSMTYASYRVLVTGSRHFTDYRAVADELVKVEARRIVSGDVHRITVVHGAARGADALAARAAEAFGMDTEPHLADWKQHGKRAGFIRNAEMVAAGADECIAFYKLGALNRGTEHCVGLAERAGIPVRRVTS